MLALWAVHIPLILARTGTTNTQLGLLLLLLGIGAFAGMQIGGHLADRFSSRKMVIIYLLWISLSVLPLGHVTRTLTLAITLFMFGIGNGGLDVAMNLQAAVIEEEYKRPIMSAFHAMFSIGTFAGSILGFIDLSIHLSIDVVFSLASILGLIGLVACSPYLLRHEGKKEHLIDHQSEDNKFTSSVRKRVLLLGGIAFLLMLSEGVANDWSALQLKESLGVSGAKAALGYAAFAVLMTIGRFGADRASAKWGAANVVSYGSGIAAVGMLIVIISPLYVLAIIGWGLFGLGISGSVPQLFTAAGKISKAKQGLIMSRVVGLGYIGLLAGPALIGGLNKFMSLNSALVLPLAFVIVAMLSARRFV